MKAYLLYTRYNDGYEHQTENVGIVLDESFAKKWSSKKLDSNYYRGYEDFTVDEIKKVIDIEEHATYLTTFFTT